MNKFTGLCKIIIVALLLTITVVPVVVAGQKNKLTGRVLAVSTSSGLFSLCSDPLHGGIRTQEFVFGVESMNRNDNESIIPVHICYANYSENFLPEDFFDYSKKYELSVIRVQVGGKGAKKNLDVSLEDVAYIKSLILNEDGDLLKSLILNEDGDLLNTFVDKRLPPKLKILDGVPESILNMNMDIMLPRYELSTTKFKTIKEKPQK